MGANACAGTGCFDSSNEIPWDYKATQPKRLFGGKNNEPIEINIKILDDDESENKVGRQLEFERGATQIFKRNQHHIKKDARVFKILNDDEDEDEYGPINIKLLDQINNQGAYQDHLDERPKSIRDIAARNQDVFR